MKKIIISVGGSVIVPDKIDIGFLAGFKILIQEFVDRGFRFVIYCGGGSTARQYQKAVQEIRGDDQEAMDWMGISATYLNAFLLKCILNESADNEIIENPTKHFDFTKNIVLACGWKPGWSTDYDAVLTAENLGIDTIINMSNIDYVYDSDPKKYPKAKPLKDISWKDFRKLVGEKWSPGLNMPFDPVAAKEAERNKLKVIIIGKDISNLRNVLEQREFKGTVVGG